VINNGKIAKMKNYGVMDEETKEPVTRTTLSILRRVTRLGDSGG